METISWIMQSQLHRKQYSDLSVGIDEADAKARVLVIGKELMYAEEPEKEEDEYGTFGFE